VREMRQKSQKRKTYIQQDVYIGRPGRLQMLSAATWWFVWLYNSNTPPQTYKKTVLIREKLSSVNSKYRKIANEIELIR
jgi:hypothetical protein